MLAQPSIRHLPADILLMHGTAVGDEALMMGESVPQIKQLRDTSTASVATTCLDMQDREHKESLLFEGTGIWWVHRLPMHLSSRRHLTRE